MVRFFEANLQHELRMMPRDTNWPRVVTVHTYEGALLAVDDMPVLGLQPVLLKRIARNHSPDTPEFERALSRATEHQIVIVMNPDDGDIVEHVLAPHYDQQIPAAQRHFKHQSVPFVQRWPLVRTADDKLVDWRTWAGRGRAPRSAQPPDRRFVCIDNESALRRYDWTVSANDVFIVSTQLACECGSGASECAKSVQTQRICTSHAGNMTPASKTSRAHWILCAPIHWQEAVRKAARGFLQIYYVLALTRKAMHKYTMLPPMRHQELAPHSWQLITHRQRLAWTC